MPSSARQQESGSGAPLVAIVTPVYNGAAFLRETMESVQSQTYPNLVHVVLDNASTDATAAILREFAHARVPVQVSRNEATISQCENWNRAMGLAPAHAQYLRILCHDDLLAPQAIERCVSAAQQDAAIGVVGCSHVVLGEIDDLGWRSGVYEGQEVLRALLRNQVRVMPPQTMLARASLPPDGFFFREQFGSFDGELMLKILASGFKFAFVAEPLCTTRVHDSSVSSSLLLQEHRNWVSRFEELLRFGPQVFTPEAHAALLRHYRRSYFRLLLRMRLNFGSQAAVAERHVAAMRQLGQPPRLVQLFDAVADWPLTKVGLRRTYWSEGRRATLTGVPLLELPAAAQHIDPAHGPAAEERKQDSPIHKCA